VAASAKMLAARASTLADQRGAIYVLTQYEYLRSATVTRAIRGRVSTVAALDPALTALRPTGVQTEYPNQPINECRYVAQVQRSWVCISDLIRINI
jgi:hypothetical protein